MVSARDILITFGAVTTLALLSSNGGCGGGKNGFDFGQGSVTNVEDASVAGDDSGSSGSSSGSTEPGDAQVFVANASADSGPCSGLGCYVQAGCTTDLTGTVYDPAGVNPLYNVVVYIPTDPLGALTPIKQGTNTCSSCDVSIGNYVTATTSDADGHFTLKGVPATTRVPLVVQIGKWRREVFLSEVKACTTIAIPGSSLTRLPAKRSEGDIPQMALVTGGADNLGCFLTGIGLDPSEYSAPHAGGRLDVYQGLSSSARSSAPGLSSGGSAGDCTTDNPNCVWNSKSNLEAYDIVLLSCEGDTFDPSDSDFNGGKNAPSNKTTTSKQALHDWLNEGGKAFATHFHYTWFKNSPDTDFQGVATWLGTSGAGDSRSLTYDIDTSFPKGVVFDQWLGNVNALTGTQIALSPVAVSVSTVNPPTTRWIYEQSTSNVKYLSFVTPIGGIPAQTSDAGSESNGAFCGKAVFTDLHAGGSPQGDIPSACGGPPLSAQLKALEFLFFDLSACVSNDSLPPPAPPLPTK